ncbi:hypothetical protein GGS21DRAFT_316043 [Xylaria nigripes]|nr:hypothetical protein GGS21DRAFT_316043 [Xylaria nigripes]
MPSQRPFFLSSLLAAFRQQTPASLSASSQPNKHTHSHASSQSTPSASYSSCPPSSSPQHAHTRSQSSAPATTRSPQPPRSASGSAMMNQLQTLPSPRPIPSHRRGSDSSSEGFRDVLGADKWYIGGRTAGGEERFFKLGVVKRARSKDRLSLDRLSL